MNCKGIRKISDWFVVCPQGHREDVSRASRPRIAGRMPATQRPAASLPTRCNWSGGEDVPIAAQTGYQGRKAVYEILPVSPKIRHMILDGCSDTHVKEQAIQEGMRTLRANAVEDVLRGVTTVDELMRVVDLKSE